MDTQRKHQLSQEESHRRNRTKGIILIVFSGITAAATLIGLLVDVSELTEKLFGNSDKPQFLTLSVRLTDMTPNPDLPRISGEVTLNYADKVETKAIGEAETYFKGIPLTMAGQQAGLRVEAQGYRPVDTTFLWKDQIITIPIRRNEDYSKLVGFVRNSDGDPLEGVAVSLDDFGLLVHTRANGQFHLDIPFDQQRLRQRIAFRMAGFQTKEFITPVLPGEPLRIVMQAK